MPSSPTNNKSLSRKVGIKSRPRVERFLRKAMHTFVPSNFHDVFGLAYRLLIKGDEAGRMAMVYSFLAVLFTPLDLVFQPLERKRYQHADEPKHPVIFVCGPPRSGTTVMGQALIRFLPVHYFNNLTSIFPRSPLTADACFGWMAQTRNEKVSTKNFYGRTAKLYQPNDALYFWDRWNGKDRKVIPSDYEKQTQEEMRSFFNAVLARYDKPLLSKNNSLNTFADLVAKVLPNARFVCMDRDPVYLAQSHLLARKFIHGSEKVPYGIRGYVPEGGKIDLDPIEDVCRQAMFHRAISRKMADTLGPDRFMLVSYREFCESKGTLIAEIAHRFLGLDLDPTVIGAQMPPIHCANSQKLEDQTYERIKSTIARLEKEHFEFG